MIGKVGFCARAALAAALVAITCGVLAATAAAEAPEFGRCVKHQLGNYKNGNCSEAVAGTGSYEWEPGVGPKHDFTISLRALTFSWKLASNIPGECHGASATGEYSGSKAVANVHLTLTECKFEEGCGTIEVTPLHGELGVWALGETAAKNKLGIKLSPESGTQYAQFTCARGLNPFTWRGGFVIAQIPANTPLSTFNFRQHKPPHFGEEQIPSNFVGESPSPLESDQSTERNGERNYVPMGWQFSGTVHNEDRIEASSIL